MIFSFFFHFLSPPSSLPPSSFFFSSFLSFYGAWGSNPCLTCARQTVYQFNKLFLKRNGLVEKCSSNLFGLFTEKGIQMANTLKDGCIFIVIRIIQVQAAIERHYHHEMGKTLIGD